MAEICRGTSNLSYSCISKLQITTGLVFFDLYHCFGWYRTSDPMRTFVNCWTEIRLWLDGCARLSWMNEITEKNWKKELLELQSVSLMIKKSRLRCFGHVEQKDDNAGVKWFTTWEVEGIRQRGRPKKTRCNCVKNDMESLGLSQKAVQFRNKWRRIKGATG